MQPTSGKFNFTEINNINPNYYTSREAFWDKDITDKFMNLDLSVIVRNMNVRIIDACSNSSKEKSLNHIRDIFGSGFFVEHTLLFHCDYLLKDFLDNKSNIEDSDIADMFGKAFANSLLNENGEIHITRKALLKIIVLLIFKAQKTIKKN